MHKYQVGEVCTLTEENLKTIKSANRSINCYPSDSYVRSISRFVGQDAIVTHVFSGGYEMTIRFGSEHFQAKTNYVTFKPQNAI